MPFSVTDLKTTIATVLDPLKGPGEILVTQDAALTRDIVDKVGRWTGFHFIVKLTGTPVDGEISLNGEDLADSTSISITFGANDAFGSYMKEIVGDVSIGSKLVLRTNDGFQFGYVINAKSNDVANRTTYTLNPISSNDAFGPYTAVSGHSIVASFLPLSSVDGSYRMVFGTHITLDNETLESVTNITFPSGGDSAGIPIERLNVGDSVILRKLDGSSILYQKIDNTFTFGVVSGVSYGIMTSGFSLSGGDILMMSINKGKENSFVLYEDTQFTNLTPQAFASGTQSLLRNNGLSQEASFPLFFYSSSWWDSNHLDVTSDVFFGVVLSVNTSLTIVPSTSNCSVLMEWVDSGAVLASKTITSNGALIFLNETLRIMKSQVNTGIIECKLTFDKDVDVYGCTHFIKFDSLLGL